MKTARRASKEIGAPGSGEKAVHETAQHACDHAIG